MVIDAIKMKKVLLGMGFAFTALCMSAISLKSTAFQRIYNNNKLIISMKPIYSEGDQAPQENTQPVMVQQVAIPQVAKRVAFSQPISIIPNYIPEQKHFTRRNIVTVNSYLKDRSSPHTQGAVAFAGTIPQSGAKYLRPAVPQNDMTEHKQYVSIER